MTETSASPQAAPVPAGVFLRLAALVYDGLLLIALFAITAAVLVPLGTPASAAHNHELATVPAWYKHLVLMPALFLASYGFYGYFWGQRGQTLGMQTWRLQTLRADGGKLGWGDALRRMLAAMVFPTVCGSASWLLQGSVGAYTLATVIGFLCNYFWIYGNAGRLAWHDQLSHSRVWRLPQAARGEKRRFGLFND